MNEGIPLKDLPAWKRAQDAKRETLQRIARAKVRIRAQQVRAHIMLGYPVPPSLQGK